jgi:hypothetical protein
VVFLHSSDTDARREFEKFTAGVRANEHLRDIDDEAYAWGKNKSVALRRGSYAVYISSIALNVPGDGWASDKRPKEEAKLSRMFAKIVVKALKDQ